MPDTATFRTTLWSGDGRNTGIEVPEEVVTGFGRGKRVPVRVEVGGYVYRSTIAVMGGRYLISFASAHRAATGLSAGDEITVNLTVDDSPREVDVPAALASALAAHPPAAAAWAALSPSRQRAYADSINGAKAEETRDRRVAKVMAELS